MSDRKFDINLLTVASPCSVGWENMTGDERTRQCDLCNLNVYDISALNAAEVEDLVLRREGRLCIRMYRRTDGTVLTRDCPVGSRAIHRRFTRFAGAALAAVLGLFSISFGQKNDSQSIDASKAKIVRTANKTGESALGGQITDPNGAVVPGAEVRLDKGGDKAAITTTSDGAGVYLLKTLPRGVYRLEIKYDGFTMSRITGIEINPNEIISLNITLKFSSRTVTVGILAEDPAIDVTSSSVTTIITSEMIDRLPH